jgi:hypothetical protein
MKKLLVFLTLFSIVNAQQLDTFIVTGKKASHFEPVGEYNQPEWTLTRKFPSTRVYVMTPPGAVMYEKWFDIRDRQNGPALIRMRDEFAFGLGHRLELDLYAHTLYDGPSTNRKFTWRGFSWEVRYALADWGNLFGNPTLYFEHKLINGRQGIEPKLLLGDRIGKTDYIWGLNLIYEANLASSKADQEREYAATVSIGKILTRQITLGLSSMYRYNDYEGTSHELYVGPNFQYRLNKHAHISLEYMPRVVKDGYDSRSLIIFAWRF